MSDDLTPTQVAKIADAVEGIKWHRAHAWDDDDDAIQYVLGQRDDPEAEAVSRKEAARIVDKMGGW